MLVCLLKCVGGSVPAAPHATIDLPAGKVPGENRRRLPWRHVDTETPNGAEGSAGWPSLSFCLCADSDLKQVKQKKKKRGGEASEALPRGSKETLEAQRRFGDGCCCGLPGDHDDVRKLFLFICFLFYSFA